MTMPVLTCGLHKEVHKWRQLSRGAVHVNVFAFVQSRDPRWSHDYVAVMSCILNNNRFMTTPRPSATLHSRKPTTFTCGAPLLPRCQLLNTLDITIQIIAINMTLA